MYLHKRKKYKSNSQKEYGTQSKRYQEQRLIQETEPL